MVILNAIIVFFYQCKSWLSKFLSIVYEFTGVANLKLKFSIKPVLGKWKVQAYMSVSSSRSSFFVENCHCVREIGMLYHCKHHSFCKCYLLETFFK